MRVRKCTRTDPTPEEIAERAAEIRQQWTPEETIRRQTPVLGSQVKGEPAEAWQPPVISRVDLFRPIERAKPE